VLVCIVYSPFVFLLYTKAGRNSEAILLNSWNLCYIRINSDCKGFVNRINAVRS